MNVFKASTSSNETSSNSSVKKQSIQLKMETNSSDTSKLEKPKSSVSQPLQFDSSIRQQIQHYLHTVSGQSKRKLINEIEHDYSKPYNIHPDPQIRAQPTKLLFMKHFPQHLTKLHYQHDDDEEIDVVSFEEQKKIPFLTPKPPTIPVQVDEDIPEIDSSITDSWTFEKNKLWTRATKIIYSDRLARLSFEGNANAVLLNRNLQEHTSQKFRELFASTYWDFKLITWLHVTLLKHLNPTFQTVYIDSLQILRQKIPTLIEKFYQNKMENKNKTMLNDALFNTLSHYKPKKLHRKPIFIWVPSSPNQNLLSPRFKYLSSLLSSLGKFTTITVTAKSTDYIIEILAEIRSMVNDKIRSFKNSPPRPIILVGFNAGSIIAAHCALQNPKLVTAVICLGFPLQTLNGARGELGDALLELTSPIQFFIGENAVMTSLDDIEDFREHMLRTETNLVVIGGADDRLVISNLKKRLESLTQSMVDRCIVDEISNFLNPIIQRFAEESSQTNDSRFLHFPTHHDDSEMINFEPAKKKSRKRSKASPGGGDPLFDPNFSPISGSFSGIGGETTPKSPTKRKRYPKYKKDGLNISSGDAGNNRITTPNSPYAQMPNFTIVPISSQVSPDQLTSLTLPDRPSFTTFKIERSKIISIDNKPIEHGAFSKKFVKKTVPGQILTTPTNSNSLKNLISNNNNKNDQQQQQNSEKTSELQTVTTTSNNSPESKTTNSSTTTSSVPTLETKSFSQNISTNKTEGNISSGEQQPSTPQTPSSTPGSTRTGRQIKFPKSIDFLS